MSALNFQISSLHPSIRATAKLLLPFWKSEEWYSEEASKFDSDKIIEVIYQISNLELSENFELLDIYYSTLDVLLRSNKLFKNEINVSGNSFWGSPNFRFKVKNLDESDNLNIISTSIELYITNNEQNPIDHLRKLSFLKSASRILDSLNFKIKLDKILNSKEIYNVVKLVPIFEEVFTDGKAHYDLNYTLTLDDATEIEVKDSNFFGDRKYLQIENKSIILSDDIYEAIDKQRKLKRLSEREMADILIKPTQNLFPPGTDLDKFDLGEYDRRVAGFELKKKSSFSEVTSMGIEWYTKDDNLVPTYTFRDDKGNSEIIVLDKDLVNDILTKVKAANDSGFLAADGEPLPVKIDEEKYISLTHQNIEELTILATTLNTPKKKKTDGEKVINETTGTNVVVIQTVIHELPDIEFPKISLTESDLVPFLNAEYIIKKHQLDGINWLLSSFYSGRGGVILADDMGLGKTLQLALFIVLVKNADKIPKLINYAKRLHKSENSPRKISMVVAPLILLQNWKDEFVKFIRKEYQPEVLILHGKTLKTLTKDDGSLKAKWLVQEDILITNYATFSRYQIDLLKIKFLINIFDESQNIKNPDTAQTRAARGLNTQFAVCATGTPIENRLLDLWPQVGTLDRKPSNPLGELNSFVNNFEKNSNGKELIRNILKIEKPDALLLRRDKALLRKLKELKEKTVKDPIYVDMTPFQREHELLIVNQFRSKPLQVLQHLQKLYQHPILLSKNYNIDEIPIEKLINDSPKLSATIDLLDQIKKDGEKVLVFTLWIEMQAILQKVFEEKYGLKVSIINGDTEKSSSALNSAKDLINKFSEKEGFNILILSPLAAGAGLNIVAANHVVHYGRWWNPAKEDQGTDRAYRIGQKKEVFVYYPILKYTNDEGRTCGFDHKLHHDVMSRKRALAYDVLSPAIVPDNNFNFEEE
jgi:SNF2 family DNA or RNA helicase